MGSWEASSRRARRSSAWRAAWYAWYASHPDFSRRVSAFRRRASLSFAAHAAVSPMLSSPSSRASSCAAGVGRAAAGARLGGG